MLLSTSLSAVEYGSLFAHKEYAGSIGVASDVIYLNEGDSVEIVGLNYNDDGFRLTVKDTSIQPGKEFNITHTSIYYSPIGEIFSGPCEVYIKQVSSGLNNNESMRVSYKLTRASEVEYKQANIVSLPLDDVGQGTHNIVVEASDDLQSWTPVHSSSIGGDKAFFRTRVVEAE